MVNVFALVVMHFLFLVLRGQENYSGYITIIDRLIEALVYPFLVGGMLAILRDAVKEGQTNVHRFPFYGKNIISDSLWYKYQ